MTTDKDLMTVGQLVEDLAEFEEEYSDWDVVCWTPDSGTDDEEGEIDWDNIDILFVTDMPYSLYQELDKE